MHKLITLSLLAGLLAMAGCSNTVKGVGADLKKAGEKIEGAVQK